MMYRVDLTATRLVGRAKKFLVAWGGLAMLRARIREAGERGGGIS